MLGLRKLHRWVGVLAALVVLWLAGTGLVLQHADDLGLGRRYLTSAGLLGWYGVRLPARVPTFLAGEVRVAEVDGRRFVGPHRVDGECAGLLGAVADGDTLVLACTDGLLRVSRDGTVQDRAGELEGIPVPLRALGRAADGALLLRTHGGVQAISADFLALSPHAGTGAVWSRPLPPGPVPDALAGAYLDGVIPFERLLADLHAGRLPGRIGGLAIDAGAIALIVLAISGLTIHFRRP